MMNSTTLKLIYLDGILKLGKQVLLIMKNKPTHQDQENAYIENGKLIIKALKENYNNADYNSARMTTQKKVIGNMGG